MSALGFPDFRRQVDLDVNPNFLTLASGIQALPITFGPYIVSNYAYFAGNINVAGAPTEVRIKFYSDQACANQVGFRVIRIDAAVSAGPTFRVPTMGRFVLISVQQAGPANQLMQATLWGSNRPTVNEIIHPSGVMVDTGAPAIAGGGTSGFNSVEMGSGSATLFMETSTQAGVFRINCFTTGLTYSPLIEITLAANTSLAVPITIPLSTITASITNSGGIAAAFRLTLTLNSSSG